MSEDMMQFPEADLPVPMMIDESTPDAIEVVLIPEEEDAAELAEILSPPIAGDPTLWLYRDRTIALLRRYGRLSVEVGRVASLLGREFFRTRVTRYRVATFEDSVIFVHDVEQALATLDWFDKCLIARVVFQDFTQDEAARMMGCARRTVVRRFPEALDQLSELFLDGGLLTRLPAPKPAPEAELPESCQEGESDENWLCDCKQDE